MLLKALDNYCQGILQKHILRFSILLEVFRTASSTKNMILKNLTYEILLIRITYSMGYSINTISKV